MKQNRVQLRNPVTRHWVKIDMKTGWVISIKKSQGPFKNVRKYRGR